MTSLAWTPSSPSSGRNTPSLTRATSPSTSSPSASRQSPSCVLPRATPFSCLSPPLTATRRQLAWGPLSLLTLTAILSRSSIRHALQVVVCVAHLYGVALYYATNWLEGVSYSRPEFLYFWVYYVGFNLPWAVVPFCKHYYSAFIHAVALTKTDWSHLCRITQGCSGIASPRFAGPSMPCGTGRRGAGSGSEARLSGEQRFPVHCNPRHCHCVANFGWHRVGHQFF